MSESTAAVASLQVTLWRLTAAVASLQMTLWRLTSAGELLQVTLWRLKSAVALLQVNLLRLMSAVASRQVTLLRLTSAVVLLQVTLLRVTSAVVLLQVTLARQLLRILRPVVEQADDATAMVSPITITVDKVRLPDNGDCSASRLRIHFEDAKGTKKDVDYGTITGMGGDATDKGGKLAPKNGEYTDLGVYCAGLQAGYTLKTGGDTLVALEIWNDEESGPGKNSKVVAQLPPGAQIVMK